MAEDVSMEITSEENSRHIAQNVKCYFAMVVVMRGGDDCPNDGCSNILTDADEQQGIWD